MAQISRKTFWLIAMFVSFVSGNVINKIIVNLTFISPDLSKCLGPDDPSCKFGTYSTSGFPFKISEWNGGLRSDSFDIRALPNIIFWCVISLIILAIAHKLLTRKS